MNQDTLQEALAKLRPCPEEFKIIFSGKRSMNRDGSCLTNTREILLHNRNFETEAELVLAGIAQYAHLLEALDGRAPRKTPSWKAMVSVLVAEAREQGLLALETAEIDEDLAALKADLLALAATERAIGERLLLLKHKCIDRNLPFEVLVEQDLRITTKTAQRLIGAGQLDLFLEDLALTSDEQALVVARGKDAGKDMALAIDEAAKAVADAPSLAAVSKAKPPRDPESPVEIKKEIRRIEKTVTSLLDKKTHLEERLEVMDNPDQPPKRSDAGTVLRFPSEVRNG